jgi:PAS domain S-box-containing protein
MQAFQRSLFDYGVAAASILAAIGLRLLLEPWIGSNFPFATVFLGIMVAAWYGGRGPALFASLLGAFGSLFFLLEPRYQITVGPTDGVGLALYCFVAAGISLLGGAMHMARWQAQQQATALASQKGQLESEVAERTAAEVALHAKQRELAEQSERWRVTLASIGDAVVASDAEGRVTFLNRVAAELTGWSLADAHGRPLHDIFQIVNESTGEIVESPVEKVLREGKIVGLANHTVLISKQGQRWPIDDSAAPIHDSSGNLMGVVLVFRDVSERRQTEEARARLAAIINSSDDAIIGKSFDGVITSWNTGAERLYGYSAAEMIGKPYSVLVPPGASDELPQVMERIRRGEQVDHYDAVRLTREGRRILVSARISAVRNDDGEITGLAVIARDMGDRDRAERRRNIRLAVTQVLAQLPAIDDGIEQILAAIGENLSWQVGAYWQVDQVAAEIRCRHLWKQREVDSAQFDAMCSDTPFRLGEGLPGRVWQSGKAHWIFDVTQEANFPRAAAAIAAGLHGAFAFPVSIGEQVFGVAEFFSCEIQPPDPDMLELAATIGTQLGQFVERQLTQQSLHRSERELSDFFDDATVGLHWEGPTGIIERANREELNILGYRPEEFVGHRIDEFHVNQAVIDDIHRRLWAGERLHDVPAQMRAKDGTICEVLIDASAMWVDGKFIHARCFMRDVTEKRRNEHMLQFLADASVALASLVDYQATLQTVCSLAVPHFADWCTVDMLNDEGQLERVAVAHVDPAKVELAHELVKKYPPDPSAPTGVWHVVRTGASELIPEITDGLLQESIPDATLLGIMRELGLRSYMGIPLQGRGRTIGVLTFITAESGRKFSVADVKVAQDLASRAAIAIENARLYAEVREAGHRKDEFLAMLAHELRNPLAPLRNGLEIMQLVENDPQALAEARGIMERQLDQMVRLVGDLLDISRITRGKLELRRERLTLASVMNTAIETSQPLIEASQHKLTVDAPTEPIELEGDETRLAQVFANLLNNAAKYTPAGGEITFAAKRQGTEAVVTVRDNGIGIAPDMLPQVFEMFTQVDRSLERAQGGLGIGLTLVRRLVEMHGGRVEAHSAGEGKGSTFTVRLPMVTEGAGDEKQNGLGHVGRLHPRRILVVDDNRDSAITLSVMLRAWGNEIRTAFDGVEAIAAASEFRPDVVLLDIGLPKLSGYDVARAIRGRLSRQPLIAALTGWGQEEDRRRSKEAGIDHHFVKPVDIEQLKRVLAKAPCAQQETSGGLATSS